MNKYKYFLALFFWFIVNQHFGQFQQTHAFLEKNDYVMNPAEIFHDKGYNIFLNHRSFYSYRPWSGGNYSVPSSNTFGFKNVFQRNPGKIGSLEQRWYPGLGVTGSYINGGGAFSEFNIHVQAGLRYSFDKINSIRLEKDNSYVAFAGGLIIGNVFTNSIQNGGDFYITNTGDPVLENFNLSYGVSRFLKLGFSIKKNIGEYYKYLSVDMSTGIPIFLNNVTSYGSEYYFQVNPKYQWRESSFISMAIRSIDASKSIQFIPYLETEWRNNRFRWFDYEFDTHYDDDFLNGLRIRKSLSVGFGAVLNLKSNIGIPNFFNQVFVNVRYSFFKYGMNKSNRYFKTNLGDLDMGYALLVNSLANVGAPINVSANYNGKITPNPCLLKKRDVLKEIENTKDLSSDKSKELISKIEELKQLTCYKTLTSKDKSDIEEKYNVLLRSIRKLEEYEKDRLIYSTKIGTQIWAKNNSTLKVNNQGIELKFASNIYDWREYCDKNEPAYCFFEFNSSNANKGCLYNFAAIRDLAPEGYRVPSKEDYSQLLNELKNRNSRNPLCLIIKPNSCIYCVSCNYSDYNSQFDFNYTPFGWLGVKKSTNEIFWDNCGDMYFWSLQPNQVHFDKKGIGIAIFKIGKTIRQVSLGEIDNWGDQSIKTGGQFEKDYYGAFIRFIKN